MADERFANNASTTLDGDITDVATTINVIDWTKFPLWGDFRVLIDSELILVTDAVNTAGVKGTWTVVRGIEGTTNVAHSSGAIATLLVTADGLYHGAALTWFAKQPPIIPFLTPPRAEDLAWVNQSTATFGGGEWNEGRAKVLQMAAGDSGHNLHVLKKALTGGVIAAAFTVAFPPMANVSAGVVLRESATGKLITWGLEYDATYGLRTVARGWTNPTTDGSYTPVALSPLLTNASPLTLIAYLPGDGNIYFMISNGYGLIYQGVAAKDAFFTVGPDEGGLFINPDGGAPSVTLTCFHLTVL